VFFSVDEPQFRNKRAMLRWLKRMLKLERAPLEIKQVLDEGEEQGLIDEDEGEMIEGIFDLKQTVAREIMIPRTHIVAVPVDAERERVLRAVISSGHSRIPIYDEDVDHIVGILNAKDLLPLWLEDAKQLDLRQITREPFFVPETKRIKDLLNELRGRKSHMAIIVDEYGGTSGLVTIEDIIEEIIGEIRDEHDVEEDPFLPQEDGSVLVRARASLDEFEEYFGVSIPREGYDTLGGFIIHVMGKVPARGEEMQYGGLVLRIQGGDEKRITRVLVTVGSREIDKKIPARPDADQ